MRERKKGMGWSGEFVLFTYLPAYLLCLIWVVLLGAYEVGIGDRAALGIFFVCDWVGD